MGVKVKLNQYNLSIEFLQGANVIYYLDLERAENSAQLLDWIFQIAGKSWCKPRVLFDLIQEIERSCRLLLKNNAQGIYCPQGIDQVVKWPINSNPAQAPSDGLE